jgi:hypothetical protein
MRRVTVTFFKWDKGKTAKKQEKRMASQSGAEAEDNERRDAAYRDGRTKCAKIPDGDRESLVNQKANADEIKRILY